MNSEFHDINPKTWLKPFEKNSVPYLLKMGLFYHGLGLILMYLGSNLVTSVIPGYEIPQIPVSVSLALSAGVLEESVFFGIPYYFSGNPIVLLGAGMAWSAAHLFNSGVLSIETLAYGGFLFSVPHLFFSIRTWISKKGWFAILFHCGWNLGILSLYCGMGVRQCSAINDTFDIINLIMATSAGVIVYLAYQNRKKQVNRFLYLAPVSVIFISLFVLFLTGDTF